MHDSKPYDGTLFAEENYALSIKNYELEEAGYRNGNRYRML